MNRQEKVWRFAYDTSRMEGEQDREQVRDYIQHAMAKSLANHIANSNNALMKEETTPYMIRHYVDLMITTPEDYWHDVQREAQELAYRMRVIK